MEPNEVKITKVYTVEAGEYSTEHDPTPNWKENSTPNRLANSFNLRIVAEAGTTIGNSGIPYQLIIQAACMTNPLAVLCGNLNAVLEGPAENFSNTGGWEYQAFGENYTKSWSVSFPTTPLFVWPFGGFMGAFNQVDQTWQFFVSLEDTASPAKAFACTAVSEPFRLL